MIHFSYGSTQDMSSLFYVYYYLWAAPHLLLVPVALLMFRKSLHKTFPIFFSYLIFEILQFCVLLPMHVVYMMHLNIFPLRMYPTVDLVGRTGSIILHFAVLQELFESPVAHNSELRRTSARMLKWVTGILVVVSLLFLGSLYYGTIGHRMVPAYATLEALNIAQCGVLVLVFLWHRYLGVTMSPLAFGIGLGMGVTACSEPLIHAWKDSLATRNSGLPDDFVFAAFHVAALIWLYFAYAQKEITSNSGSTLQVREWAADAGRVAHL